MRLSGYEARFISLADDINRTMPRHTSCGSSPTR
jgi:UDP-N-acetyl-D-mannosaminuronate dehydrogenase